MAEALDIYLIASPRGHNRTVSVRPYLKALEKNEEGEVL